MAEYIILMHENTSREELISDWPIYLKKLETQGALRGGSSIGTGEALRKDGSASAISAISGYIVIHADDLNSAKALLIGNPCMEAGGTVELRELIKD